MKSNHPFCGGFVFLYSSNHTPNRQGEHLFDRLIIFSSALLAELLKTLTSHLTSQAPHTSVISLYALLSLNPLISLLVTMDLRAVRKAISSLCQNVHVLVLEQKEREANPNEFNLPRGETTYHSLISELRKLIQLHLQCIAEWTTISPELCNDRDIVMSIVEAFSRAHTVSNDAELFRNASPTPPDIPPTMRFVSRIMKDLQHQDTLQSQEHSLSETQETSQFYLKKLMSTVNVAPIRYGPEVMQSMVKTSDDEAIKPLLFSMNHSILLATQLPSGRLHSFLSYCEDVVRIIAEDNTGKYAWEFTQASDACALTEIPKFPVQSNLTKKTINRGPLPVPPKRDSNTKRKSADPPKFVVDLSSLQYSRLLPYSRDSHVLPLHNPLMDESEVDKIEEMLQQYV